MRIALLSGNDVECSMAIVRTKVRRWEGASGREASLIETIVREVQDQCSVRSKSVRNILPSDPLNSRLARINLSEIARHIIEG